MKYEEIYKYIGQIGTFQMCVCTCLIFYCLFAFDSLTMIFVGAIMPHFCMVEELGNFSYDLQKYIAIPTNDDGEYESCEMYVFDYGNYSREEFLKWNRTEMVKNSTGTVACFRWIYQQDTFIATIVSRFTLVCDKAYLISLVSTFYMAGSVIGGGVGGPMSDKLGRKLTILIFLAIKVVGVVLSTFSPNYATFIVGRFIMGFGSFGCFNTCYVLIMELVGPKYRSVMGGSMRIASSFCFVLQPFIAYMDRRDVTYQLASLGPNAVLLLFAFVVSESPRWLIVSGRHEKAQELFEQMATVNRTTLPPDFNTEQIERDEISSGSVILLFRYPVMRLRTVICSYMCFAVDLIYFAMSLNTGALYGNIFLNTLISASIEVPTSVLCIFLVDWKFLGRKFTTFLSLFISGVCCLLCIPMVLFDIGVGETALSIGGKSMSVLAFSTIYIFSSEIFPTEVRNAGMGVIGVVGGIGKMAASFIGPPMAKVWPPLPYLVLGVVGLLAALMCLPLPETLGHPLQDTVEQAEQFKGGMIRALKVEEQISADGPSSSSSSFSSSFENEQQCHGDRNDACIDNCHSIQFSGLSEDGKWKYQTTHL